MYNIPYDSLSEEMIRHGRGFISATICEDRRGEPFKFYLNHENGSSIQIWSFLYPGKHWNEIGTLIIKVTYDKIEGKNFALPNGFRNFSYFDKLIDPSQEEYTETGLVIYAQNEVDIVIQASASPYKLFIETSFYTASEPEVPAASCGRVPWFGYG